MQRRITLGLTLFNRCHPKLISLFQSFMSYYKWRISVLRMYITSYLNIAWMQNASENDTQFWTLKAHNSGVKNIQTLIFIRITFGIPNNEEYTSVRSSSVSHAVPPNNICPAFSALNMYFFNRRSNYEGLYLVNHHVYSFIEVLLYRYFIMIRWHVLSFFLPYNHNNIKLYFALYI